MNISGIGGAGASQSTTKMTAGKNGQMDAESKNLQQQIEKLQNDLKEISANADMPADTKMKKRQEILKQISELQIQLRQHQIDARRKEQEKKKEESSFDDLMGTKKQENLNGKPDIGMSTESMTAIISADVSVKQANTQGSTAKKMENRANILEIEIKLDKSRGGSSNVGLKEAEMADAREAAQKATSDQIASLAQAGEELKNASKKDNAADRTEEKEKEEKGVSGDEKDGENPSETVSSDTPAPEPLEEQAAYGYHPVDVRL